MTSNSKLGPEYAEPGTIPRHIAVVMDGNGRWAQARGLPRIAGHRRGMEAAESLVRACCQRGIGVLTLFAFSSENWRRPAPEVERLLKLFTEALTERVPKLHEQGIRVRFIGDITRFGATLQERIRRAESLTADNSALTLNIAANYGGRWDVMQACQRLARQVREGRAEPDDIDEQTIARATALGDVPEPDLLIRTGGEIRLSNFLIWHLAYTELYFTETLWPDFDQTALEQALRCFAERQRRFGAVPEPAEHATDLADTFQPVEAVSGDPG